MDKKGQTALHIAAKGTNVEVVEELINADRSSINIADTKGNTALHIADRKGRSHIVKLLLDNNITDTKAVNRTGEMALDTAEKVGNPEVALILQKHGVPSAKTIKPSGTTNPARELKQTVSDIKHEVHNQLEHTRQTRRRVQGIAKQLNKMHTEGLNNAINSTTVVAVLIATVAFAAIFTVPGQYVEDTSNLPDGHSLGEANIASTTPFIIFFIFDFIALFISLAVVVVQTSVVVIESKAKKQMMAVINRLACVLMRSHLRFEEDLNLFKMVLMLKVLMLTYIFGTCNGLHMQKIITSPYMLNEFDVSSYPKVGSNTFYPDFSHRFEEQEGCVLVTESSSVDSTSNVKAPVKREGSPIERIEPAFYQSSANNHGPSVTIKKAKTEKSG
ncbi:hypothetical protein HID58_059496 [Brassica napus]|uniref:PGG domain-containing protein n=1 Tax=Brassica napus TaxID=3708 RepID=A0ABQ7ZT46_BRANA|nr:hypothetical protein HID58_059496 [Brassica napus]